MPGDNGNDVISNKEKNCRGMTFREKTKKIIGYDVPGNRSATADPQRERYSHT
jgi:hypothetical protein